MGRKILTLASMVLALTALCNGSAYAKDIAVNSKITAATVYNNRASVTRTAEIDIPAGEHTLVFKGLPLSIFTDSLRIEGKSRVNVTFGALSHKRESFEDFVVPREQELNAQLLTLQDNNKVFSAEKRALDIARKFLENLGKEAALRENENIAEIDLNPEQWSAVADSLTDKVAKNLKQNIALDIKIRETNDKIQKIHNELNGLRTGQKQTYMVNVPFEADQSGTLIVDLTYQINNASWSPIYDARLDVTSAKMELIQYGSVYQRTGEDWTDVKLTLSTAQPSRGASLPDLQPNWLSIQQNYAKRGGGNNFAGVTTLTANRMAEPEMMAADMLEMEVAAVPASEELTKASFAPAHINTEGFIGEYEITGPASVKSNGEQSKLLIGAFDTENDLIVQVKPQISTDAYLVVKTKLKGEAPILAGQVNLFRDGAYIGQTYVKMLRPDDEAKLAFGIDDNITVRRNTLSDNLSETGLISKTTAIERAFVTEIRNLHKKPIKIAILETMPTSKDERIDVKISKEKTTPGFESDVDDIKGLLRWEKQAVAGEAFKINLGWSVSWPKDENIIGLR